MANLQLLTLLLALAAVWVPGPAWSAAEGTAAGQDVRAEAEQEPTYTEGTIKFFDIDIAYYLYEPAPRPAPEGGLREAPTAVFLHGAKYHGHYWVELGTLQKVAATGIRALSVDLPGYGNTRGLPYLDNNMRAEVVKAVVDFASPKPNSTVFLISPSMSGRFSIPFLDRHGTVLTSYVALAPVGVKKWGGPWEDTHKRVCALALYGSEDPMAPEADLLIKFFQKTWKIIVPAAGHRSYEDQPTAFHDVLLKFLWKCYRKPDGSHEVRPDNEIKVELAKPTVHRPDL